MALHYAMRESERKTVTAAKSSHRAREFGPERTEVPDAKREALDQLFSLTYEELRRLASSVRRGDPSATLSPTALVNEAWLKLAKSPDVPRPHGCISNASQPVRCGSCWWKPRGDGTPESAAAARKITVTFDEAFQRETLRRRRASGAEHRAGRAGAHESATGGDGGEPLLRGTRRAGDGSAPERIRSYCASRLASRQGMANPRAAQGVTADGRPFSFLFGGRAKMDSTRWQRVQSLFHEAADMPASEQRSYLEAQCGDDAALVSEVLVLLEEDARGGSLLDGDVATVASQILDRFDVRLTPASRNSDRTGSNRR